MFDSSLCLAVSHQWPSLEPSRHLLSTLTVDSDVIWEFMGITYSMVKHRPRSSPVETRNHCHFWVPLQHGCEVSTSQMFLWPVSLYLGWRNTLGRFSSLGWWLTARGGGHILVSLSSRVRTKTWEEVSTEICTQQAPGASCCF